MTPEQIERLEKAAGALVGRTDGTVVVDLDDLRALLAEWEELGREVEALTTQFNRQTETNAELRREIERLKAEQLLAASQQKG